MGLFRRAPEPSAPVVPWEDGGLRAEVVPAGRRRTVVLTAGDVQVQLAAAEVRELLRGRTGIAESTGSPLAFLCRPASAAPGSVVHEVVAHLPAQALALVVAAEPPAVAAVLDGAALESFTAWGRDLAG